MSQAVAGPGCKPCAACRPVQLPGAACLLAEVEVQVGHHQPVLVARQRRRAAGVGRRKVAAAVEVAKVLGGSAASRAGA